MLPRHHAWERLVQSVAFQGPAQGSASRKRLASSVPPPPPPNIQHTNPAPRSPGQILWRGHVWTALGQEAETRNDSTGQTFLFAHLNIHNRWWSNSQVSCFPSKRTLMHTNVINVYNVIIYLLYTPTLWQVSQFLPFWKILQVKPIQNIRCTKTCIIQE